MAAFSDSHKYKSLIADEQTKIEKLYTEIGRIYFESHIDCYEEVFDSLISEITNSFKAIASYEEQLQAINEKTLCPKCKAEIMPGAQFCTVCGTSLASQVSSSNKNLCTKCNAPLMPDAQFCTTCGAKIAENDPAPSADSSPTSVCQKCGTVLPVGTNFCTACGTKAESATIPDSPPVMSIAFTCKKCGAPFDYGTKFCTTCGFKIESETSGASAPFIPPVANPISSSCYKCGAILQPGSNFCTACGTKIS